MREVERRRQQQAARVAAMTPEQRARYDHWHQTHRPGGASGLAAAKRDLEAAALIATPAPERPPSAEIEALAAERARLEALRDQLMAAETLNTDEKVQPNG